jgi:peptidyl-prolyl cis-trans isomerase D
MLQQLRSSSAGIVAKAFMVLLIISFGAWGVQGYLNEASQGEAVVTIGGDTITTSELAAAFGRDVRRFQAQGSDLTAEQARNLGLMNLALDRLITGRIYDAASDWLSMGLGDKRIAEAIRAEPAFFDDSGAFSRSRFEFLLRNSNMSEHQYATDLRRDMIRREIINSLAFTDGAPIALEKKLHLYRNEQRVVTLSVVPVDKTLDVGAPDEATLTQSHQDQAERYTAPERRAASYLLLTAEDAMRDVTVTEEQIRSRYDTSLGNYTTPEKKTIQQIRFGDEETARKAAGMIGEGRAFEAVAKDIAGMEGEALKYGEFGAGNFPIPELVAAIDALDVGGMSEPVSTDFGWHIFRVSAIQAESVTPFEDVRANIEQSLKKELAGELLYGMSTTLEDDLAGGATLDTAAAALGIKIAKSGLIDIEGAGVDGKPMDGLPGGEFINTVFVTQAGEQSALGQNVDGSYYILRVDEIVTSALRPLDEVRDEIVADWRAGKQREAAQTRALALVERVENGESLSEIATAVGLSANDSKPFNRRSEGAESNLVTPLLVSDVFKLQPGQGAMVETGDGFVVAQLKSIQAAGPSNTKDMATLIGNQMTGDILRQLDDALRKKFKVDIDQAALARTPLPQ